ncbi:class I poly(R)-hydroxyalkanoic acid synthase [Marinibactrum halimedae]|uniref:Class I poly(R)-hydroxyalkanoic acid synthase n=1 Tax=Marinibactrum halimedae TaxID=1444977 RepID=A0AA37TEI4_9GAMM|nr:class I poly(R)-hydroxyalkanoic acid synthase [Marinibactrum halimedae]MCD9459396.1 class I poly(R)-hydroxyalkanoic acid synthase [Marinibactrum halimedae]GLS27537.1 class I poly(R)-hydroxyalkanoic acid synthase [Marinibactrum halimedae]
MERGEQAQVMQYLDKYRGLFNAMAQEVMKRMMSGGARAEINPLMNTDKVMKILSRSVKVDPSRLMQEQMKFLEQQIHLWQHTAEAFISGNNPEVVVSPERGDRRFKDEQWDSNPMFSYFKQAYLLNASFLNNFVDILEFEDHKTAEQVKFFTRQYINSLSPTNYLLTNPEVCRDILESEGECLAKGIDNFMRDLENSPLEAFKIGQVDINAFKLGEHLATTPGEVVFENDLFQLIQYAPTTKEVYATPLLVVPPFINKYYILDLDEKKSLIRWLVGQGYQVFLMSWVNPTEDHAEKKFDHYISEGVVTALDVIEKIADAPSINVAGYCIGGTVVGIAASVLQKRNDKRINSATFLTTLFDFSEPGEVGNYISEQSYPMIEQSAKANGYFDGRILAFSFSLLRENNLFWSFFIDNYLKGKDPTPFDILYWNSDSTNIPTDAFLYYLRNMYMENRLREPGALHLDGESIHLQRLDVPTYALATVSDHIVLWQQAYESAKLIGQMTTTPNRNVRFVLAGSGHVAGVVNPADGGKYDHWVNESLPESAEHWLESATEVSGSWWKDWDQWLASRSGEKQSANAQLGSDEFPPIEAAPGRYVKVRLEKAPEEVIAQAQAMHKANVGDNPDDNAAAPSSSQSDSGSVKPKAKRTRRKRTQEPEKTQ